MSGDALTITVLGCSGTYAAPGGACSGYLLRSATTAVWLDCGPGTLANLQRHVPLTEVDGIVCSHSHPDHWLELPVALNAFRYGIGRPEGRLPLHWTAQTAKRFAGVNGRPPEPTFASTVIDERSRFTIGDIDFSCSRTDHPVETLAVRADSGGRSIAYSADTGNGWSLSSLGEGIDVAVVEATLDEGQVGTVQHLTGRQAGEQAQRAGVATLVLTHLAPGSDPEARTAAATSAFDGTVVVAAIDERY